MKKKYVIPDFPEILHGGDYNPDQWLSMPEVIDQDFELMEKASCNTFSVGIFSWGQLEIEQDVFEFGWLDDIFRRCEKNGRKLFLATPSAARPAWMGKEHPETSAMHSPGIRDRWFGRQNICLSSSFLRERIAIINRKLSERYGNHPVLLGWHISNEYAGECRCEICQRHFYDWLRKRYKTLENLNRCYWSGFWSHTFTQWEQVNPFDGAVNVAQTDWLRFTTAQWVDYFRAEIAEVREFSSKPVTTNMMGLYGNLDYWKLAEDCDFIADDCYPTWYNGITHEVAADFSMLHDMHYTMKNKPFIVMESCPGIPQYKPYVKLRRPGEFQREMLMALGHGADGTMYFQWRKGLGNAEQLHGAVVGHDGSDKTLCFQRVADYGKHLKNIREITGTLRKQDIAVIYDWENRWTLQNISGFSEEGKKQDDTVRLHYQALWEKNFDIAVIDSDRDFMYYKMIVAPALYMLKNGMEEKIRKFVENGGIFVMTYLSAWVDQNNFCFSGGNPGGAPLRKLFGIWSEDIDGLEPSDKQFILWNGKEYTVKMWAEYLHSEGAETVGTYGGQFYEGSPAVTIHRIGKGEAVYIGACTGLDFLSDFYGELATRCGVQSVLEGLPTDLKASRRIDPETGAEYYFLLNMSNESQEFTLPFPMYDLWNTCDAAPLLRLPSCGSTVLRRS